MKSDYHQLGIQLYDFQYLEMNKYKNIIYTKIAKKKEKKRKKMAHNFFIFTNFVKIFENMVAQT